MTELEQVKNVYRAIENNDVDQVIDILRESPKLISEKTHLGSWLHQAAINGQHDLVMKLLVEGIDVNIEGWEDDGYPLTKAASYGHLDIVQYLHEQGGILDTSESQRNPLFAAIVGGHTDVARYLIDHGIDVTPKYQIGDITDMDALKFAQHWGRSEIVELIHQRLDTL